MVLDSSGLYVLRRARKPAARQHATIGCPKSDAVNRLFKKDAINVTQQTYHANGAPAAFRAMAVPRVGTLRCTGSFQLLARSRRPTNRAELAFSGPKTNWVKSAFGMSRTKTQ